jgi:hypothetical protein
MTRLVVAGCSVSDYTQVDKVWGEYLAEQLSYEYLHLAAGCGSNYRMWRLLVSHVVDNKITADDTVIVQYTSPERNEFWSPRHRVNGQVVDDHIPSGGSIVRIKYDTYTQCDGAERKFAKLWPRFINIEFELEKFRVNHMMFQCLMKEYGIKNLYFVQAGYYGLSLGDLQLLELYKNNNIICNDIFRVETCLPNDLSHFNDAGHKLLAEIVATELLQ